MRTIVVLLLLGVAAGARADKPRRIAIEVTKAGFAPDHIRVPRHQRVTLVFERTTDETCTKEVVIDTGKQKIERALPLGRPVAITLTFEKAGELTYACGMDMFTGTILVK